MSANKRPGDANLESSDNRPSRRQRAVENYSLEDIAKGREEIIRRHIYAEATRSNYDGHVSRGQDFLQKICKLHQNGNDLEALRGKDAINGSDSNIAGSPTHDPLFRHAFDETPNEFSPEALEMFLTQKCFNEGKGKSTAEGIYAAFKKYWDQRYAVLSFCDLAT